jgi:protein-S-isoprenylcysteine O-methyltransferase Ste14
MPDITQWPALYLGFAALHLLAGQFGSAWIFRARFGGSPLVIYARGGAPTPHMRTTRLLTAPALIWAGAVVAFALSPGFRATWLGAPLLSIPPWVGWALGLVGLFGMMGSQAAMGASFRVGQDDALGEGADDAPALVTHGIYAHSRNPIYLFSFLYVAAITSWAPCALAIAGAAAVGALMHKLVLCEEEYMAGRLGAEYDAYRDEVRRYL